MIFLSVSQSISLSFFLSLHGIYFLFMHGDQKLTLISQLLSMCYFLRQSFTVPGAHQLGYIKPDWSFLALQSQAYD